MIKNYWKFISKQNISNNEETTFIILFNTQSGQAIEIVKDFYFGSLWGIAILLLWNGSPV